MITDAHILGIFLLAKGSRSLLLTRVYLNWSPLEAVTSLKGEAGMVEVQVLGLKE